jgi:apolipoprotein N-acyltransferase
LAGGANLLAFAPFYCWPIQIFSLSALLLLVMQREQDSAKRQSVLVWAYGFSWLATGFGWLVIALARYGDLPWILSIIAIALLAALLAIYLACAFYCARYFQQRWHSSVSIFLLGIFPALFVIAEWLRAWVFTGFPWVSSGYVHTASWLAGYAPLIGVYGIGWLNALIAGALSLALLDRTTSVRMALFAGILFFVGFLLQKIEWTSPQGQPIQVRLLQGNIDQGIKFDADHLRSTLNLYQSLITKRPADLIATPETALPILSSDLPPGYLSDLEAFTLQTHSKLILGVVLHDGDARYSNSVIGLGGTNAASFYRYDKHHLVPFGEFVPYGFRWFTNLMQIPLGDLTSAGLYQKPMQVKDQYVMPNICYEDVFGEEIAAQLAAQYAANDPIASILLNVSNLAWYGDSTAIPQHLQISTMRVLETGRPMLRATNTGATAVVNAKAQVVGELKPLTQDSLSVSVQGMKGMTPYILLGNRTILFISITSLLLAFLRSKKYRR